MKIITQPTKLVYFSPDILNRMNRLLEPTVEVSAARDYQLNEFIAAGGQAVNAMDAYPGRFLTIPGSLIEDADSDFSSDTGNWTQGAGVSITGGVLRFDGGAGDASITIDLGVGTYQVMFILSSYVGNNITLDAGGALGTTRLSNGTFVENVVGGGSTTFTFVNGGSFEGDIEIVTIKLISAYRIDVVTNRRGSYDFVVVDGHNMLDAYGGSLAQQIELYHNTVDDFGTATKVTGIKEISGLLGEETPLLNFDGTDSVDCGTAIEGLAPAATFVVLADIDDLTGTYTYISNSSDTTERYVVQVTAGVVKAGFFNGSSYTQKNGPITLGKHLIILTKDGDDVILTIDDVVQTGSGNPTTAATDKLIIGARTDLANKFKGDIYEATVYNRVLSVSEKTALFNGGEIAAADKWGNTTELMPNIEDRDFSAPSAWANFDLNSFDETGDLSLTSGFADEYCTLPIASAPMTAGFRYRLSFDVPFVAGQQWDIKDFTGAQTFGTPAAGTGSQFIEFVVDTAITGGLRIVAKLGAANVSFDNFSLIKIGAVASYSAEGLSVSQGTWFNDAGNGIDGTVNGAQFDNAPTDNGFYFLEFDTVTNAQFWFVQFNSGDVVALQDGQIGNITIGKKVAINRGRTVSSGGSYDRGLSVRKNDSGRVFAEQLHGEQPGYGVSYTKIADKSKFDALLIMINEMKNGLFPFYVSFDYDVGVPTVERVRVDGRVTWKCNSFEGDKKASWDLSFKLLTDLN